ncbi:hypothetical protein [Massilia endophytica]|uniref:hypothetical protein n=1 Tax=Massilia endophytica TaxID=2899220 RepID=UPI001E3505AC|nr:hypothetical protein [Massilia endophytica]UGQ44948.1 hypothetical protein LSQ66_14190 [Massilia endophytica]
MNTKSTREQKRAEKRKAGQLRGYFGASLIAHFEEQRPDLRLRKQVHEAHAARAAAKRAANTF